MLIIKVKIKPKFPIKSEPVVENAKLNPIMNHCFKNNIIISFD